MIGTLAYSSTDQSGQRRWFPINANRSIERSFIMAKDRLITPSYCFILAANFLLYFGFWLLIPVLPFYLSEFFQAGNSTIGIVLSCYTVAALCIRPFSGYLLDTFARKPLYLFAYFIFMMMFGGYLIAGSLTLFIIFRIIHGVSFGMVTVGGNTVVIDIMPSSRRGEGRTFPSGCSPAARRGRA